MAKKRKLLDMDITHISLVHAGANQKDIIYKSNNRNPTQEHKFNISKSEPEKGLIYGIVYAPDEVDTDGDYSTVEEIEKAAYSFMKNLRLQNIDKDHSFNTVDAYVCESWVTRENDALFKDEPIGSWAVCIKLESDELKEAVKNGEIAGISMAGTSSTTQEEVKSMTKLKDVVKNMFTTKKSDKKEDGNMDKETKEFLEEMSNTLSEGLEKIGAEIEELKAENEKLKEDQDDVKKFMKQSKQEDSFEKSDSDKFAGVGIV
jgi:molecular chaperone DnaK (HSP70)